MPNVSAKVSGLDTGSADWAAAEITPYIDRALEVFGPQRPIGRSAARNLVERFMTVCEYMAGGMGGT